MATTMIAIATSSPLTTTSVVVKEKKAMKHSKKKKADADGGVEVVSDAQWISAMVFDEHAEETSTERASTGKAMH